MFFLFSLKYITIYFFLYFILYIVVIFTFFFKMILFLSFNYIVSLTKEIYAFSLYLSMLIVYLSAPELSPVFNSCNLAGRSSTS
jgi:hypothetical protein